MHFCNQNLGFILKNIPPQLQTPLHPVHPPTPMKAEYTARHFVHCALHATLYDPPHCNSTRVNGPGSGDGGGGGVIVSLGGVCPWRAKLNAGFDDACAL